MFKITGNEIRDLIISLVVISLGFSILYSNHNYSSIIGIFPMVLIGVGLGFILHELAHKFAALHYGYWAEFKLSPIGLIISLITSFFGFIFAAPGAVYIYGYNMNDRENGIISIVGPITNIILALIFLVILLNLKTFLLVGSASYIIVGIVAYLGFSVNAFLALFNLLPISVLDGTKVFNWNPIIWLITILFSGFLVYISYTGGLNMLM
ncbi:site-2 protease family protein [Methanobrevibacter sp. 87.7]|uniref:site-2 protease family protein n=1 Tax=Methanobrevibacter sp. 87.7 TaxID=387957 RepID=UPI000B51279D|nr:site-2 protease family protein [Methanobrevibacter sp. 87.7]OWT33750.1 site-2 protease family protein [Methanobrevibacter sp. 87.7]